MEIYCWLAIPHGDILLASYHMDIQLCVALCVAKYTQSLEKSTDVAVVLHGQPLFLLREGYQFQYKWPA